MDLKQLWYFTKLAERQHISQTADQLNISQSALSKSIQALEDELGVPLFDRKGKRIELNENGRDYLEYARQALESVQKGAEVIRSGRYEVKGDIRIKAMANIDFLYDQLLTYQELNPHVRFCIENGQGDQLQEDKVDILVSVDYEEAFAYYKSHFWNIVLLREERMGVLVSRNSPWFPGTQVQEVRLLDFQDAPFVSLMRKTFHGDDLVVRTCMSAGFKPKICCKADDYRFRLGIVARGLGITIITDAGVEKAKTISEDLFFFPLAKERLYRVHMLHPPKSMLSEAAQDFLEFLNLEEIKM